MKNRLTSLLLAGLTTGSVFLSGCNNEEPKKEQLPEARVVQTLPPVDPAKQHIEDVYSALRDLPGNMTYSPYIGKNGVPCIGFGTPISEQALDQILLAKPYANPCSITQKRQAMRDLYKDGYSEYRTDNTSIRLLTKTYIQAVLPEMRQLMPNFDKAPIKAQAVAFQMHLILGDRFNKYAKFHAALNEGRYADAAVQSYITKDRYNADRKEALQSLEGNSKAQTQTIPAVLLASQHRNSNGL